MKTSKMIIWYEEQKKLGLSQEEIITKSDLLITPNDGV